MSSKATWRSGYAAVCKTVYPGSIPGVASNKLRVLDSRRQSSRFGGDVLRSVVLILAALALAACSLGGRFAYVRADGQDIGDPAVSQQFNKDRMVCQAEMHVAAAPAIRTATTISLGEATPCRIAWRRKATWW